jgi:hypothetical protein
LASEVVDMRGRMLRTVLLIGGVLLLAGCAAGANDVAGTAAADGDVAGFWLGLWHGAIVPITFIVSLFTDTVNIYEVHNSGNWYDFGFVLGLTCSIGGGAGGGASRRGR